MKRTKKGTRNMKIRSIHCVNKLSVYNKAGESDYKVNRRFIVVTILVEKNNYNKSLIRRIYRKIFGLMVLNQPHV